MAKNIVVVITTGGTIAMRNKGGGAVPSVRGAALVAGLAEGLNAELQIEEFSNTPSSHLDAERLWALQKTVVDRLERLYVRGVVVTHGTDTLEETAYLLDYTSPSYKSIVLTGAMRVTDERGYDGERNLYNAIRVALDSEADNRGAMVVMNDQIHAARYVTKLLSHGAETFQSPGWGPMGRIYDGRIEWGWKLEHQALPVRALEADVHLIKAVAGASDLMLRLLVEQRVRGIVIEALGASRVPPWWMPHIRAAVAQGTAVVIASRAASGYADDAYGYPGAARDLEAAGAVLAEGLTGPKARIRLMCALGAVA